jgi:hypothetical protein
MRPANSRHDTLLVFSDYLEEIGEIKKSQQLREDIYDTPNNSWHYEYRFGISSGVGVGGGGGSGVGGSGVGGVGVGGVSGGVGGVSGGIGIGIGVGGNE